MEEKIVLAFGTFDQLHPGHAFFLTSASALADRLLVGVARDAHVKELKRKDPVQDERARLAAVASLPYVSQAVLCDEDLGSFHILKHLHPDVIAIGHDQQELLKSLQEWFLETHTSIPITELTYAP